MEAKSKMEAKEKAIKLIKEVRKRGDYAMLKAHFCHLHNFDLDHIKFKAIEEELRKVASMIQDEFETGYVPHE